MASFNKTDSSDDDGNCLAHVAISLTGSTTYMVGEYESDHEDPIGDLVQQPVTVINGTGHTEEIKESIIDTGSKYSLIALDLALRLRLIISPMLKRKELKWLNGQPLVASWFTNLGVSLPKFGVSQKTFSVLVVDIQESGFLLLGRQAIHKLDLIPKLWGLKQLSRPAGTNPGREDTSPNGNRTLVILDSRRTKEQKKHDEDGHRKGASEARWLAEIRMLHDRQTSSVGLGNKSSVSSATEHQSASSQASSSLPSVFSGISNSASEATSISPPPSTKTEGQEVTTSK